MRSIQASMK